MIELIARENIFRFEREWAGLKSLVYKGIHYNALLPLRYALKMASLGLPVTGPSWTYYAMVSLVGAIYDSNPSSSNEIFIRLSALRIFSKFYPKLSSIEKNAMLVNTISLIKIIGPI